MFTGIVSKMVAVSAIEKGNQPFISCESVFPQLTLGGSLAINGVCLTLSHIVDSGWRFDLSSETLKRSNLGDLRKGDWLNLELPLTLQDFLGGHVQTGHVDGTARVRAIRGGSSSWRFSFTFQERQWIHFLVPKGSVAVNGVSLTVTEVSSATFSVEVIPHTFEATNFQYLRVNERVNVELDLIAKYLYNFSQRKSIG